MTDAQGRPFRCTEFLEAQGLEWSISEQLDVL